MIENPKTVADRAANYFGVYDKPRTSIRTGPKSCLMVAELNGRTTIMTYHEEHAVRGDFVKLTERQRGLLIEALDWTGQAEREDQADASSQNLATPGHKHPLRESGDA